MYRCINDKTLPVSDRNTLDVIALKPSLDNSARDIKSVERCSRGTLMSYADTSAQHRICFINSFLLMNILLIYLFVGLFVLLQNNV